MAKRNKKGRFVKGGGGGTKRAPAAKIVRVQSSPTTIRVAAPRTAAKRRRKGTSRRSSGGLSSIGNFFGGRGGHRTAIVVGSAALGFAQKEGWLAKLPLIGKGPITSFGLLGWGAEELLHMKLPSIVSDMITSALALSAFNIGLSGGQTIVGEPPGGAVFFD